VRASMCVWCWFRCVSLPPSLALLLLTSLRPTRRAATTQVQRLTYRRRHSYNTKSNKVKMYVSAAAAPPPPPSAWIPMAPYVSSPFFAAPPSHLSLSRLFVIWCVNPQCEDPRWKAHLPVQEEAGEGCQVR
jgi:hypothetical protein